MRNSRITSSVLALAIGGAWFSGCGNNNDVALGTDPGAPTTTAIATTVAASPVIPITLPAIPQIALPDITELSKTGDVVASKLGTLISPINGVDVVTASCATKGGNLVYQGTTGTDLFAIAHDGSGEYHKQSSDGLVTLQVAADGSGEYYDKSAGGLVTIKVASDGSGQYYSEQPGGGKVTVDVAANGSGVYYDDRKQSVLTITLPGDGSGRYYDQTADGLLTVDARRDGSGQYYYKSSGGELTTVDSDGTGWWKLIDVTSARLVEVTVQADMTGHYRETGLTPLEFDFDRTGQGLAPQDTWAVKLPAARPAFSVAGRFPPLGKLGSLSPPCATVIRFDETLLFDFNSSTLRPEAGQTLDQVAAALIAAAKPIEVNGHTDSKGDDAYNLELSRKRAEAVDAALKAKGLTVPVTVNGFGESQPLVPNTDPAGNDDPAGRAQNRRVEIVIRES